MTDTRSPFSPGLLRHLRPRKVALFRASRIGDFLCATPAFRAIRRAVPEAEITLVGLPLVADLAERSPSLDRFVPFPGMPGIAEQFFDASTALAFLGRMQAERFDLVVQMHGSGVHSNPIALMFGGRATAGFIRSGDRPGRLDAAFEVPDGLPEILRLLALADFLGALPAGEHTEFPLQPRDERVVNAVLRTVRPPLVGLHAGAREASKRWAPERFAAVGNLLAGRFGGTVVILGGPDEIDVARRVAGQLLAPWLDLSGRIGLPSLGGIVRRLGVLVTNDSGPAHVGYAVGTPTVTVYGGTDPDRWRPLAPGPFRFFAHPVSCRPCDHAECPLDRSCLDAVPVEDVADAAAEVMRV